MSNPFNTIIILTALLSLTATHAASNELIIVKESKLETILDGKEKRYEASGVTVVNNAFYVVFDNSSEVARVTTDLSKTKRLGKKKKDIGFEGIAYNPENKTFYLLEESLKHNGDYSARLNTKKKKHFQSADEQWLDYPFESDNKGFEGLATLQRNGMTYLLALCEGNNCKAGKAGKMPGGGVIQLYAKKKKKFKHISTIHLPKSLPFVDYSGLDISADNTLAVSSQESSALWIGKLDTNRWKVVENGKIYRFPTNKKGERVYCNVEGVAWIDNRHLVAVSDAKKGDQPKSCKKREQSIHILKL